MYTNLVKYLVSSIILFIFFTIAYINSAVWVGIAIWMISGIQAMAISGGGYRSTLKNDPHTLWGSLNIPGKLILIIVCVILGAFLMFILTAVEAICCTKGIEED